MTKQQEKENRTFLISEMSEMDLQMDMTLGFDLMECLAMSYADLQSEYRHMKDIYSYIATQRGIC